MKVKIFGFMNTDKGLDVSDLEKEVNDWLERHPDIKIVKIKQSSNGGSWMNTKVILSVWYEEGI